MWVINWYICKLIFLPYSPVVSRLKLFVIYYILLWNNFKYI